MSFVFGHFTTAVVVVSVLPSWFTEVQIAPAEVALQLAETFPWAWQLAPQGASEVH